MEMKYVDDPKINEKVSEIIEELKEEIVSHFHPKSIILTGSFGRGEATVVEENGKLKFLSDCEIILIPYKWIFDRWKINEFERDFYEKTGLKVEIWGFTPTLYLCFPLINYKMKPTVASYDLKYGSKVIYGKDYLKKIPNFRPEDIPLWEGVKLILNRMAEAMEYFSLEDPSQEMVFWTDKIVLACQDALLLSLRKYHPSLRRRNELFRKHFFTFKEIEIKNLLYMATNATERKLSGKIHVIDPLNYWFSASEVANKVFRYIIKKCFNIVFEDWADFHKQYLKRVTSSFPTPQNFLTYFKLFLFKKTGNPLPLNSLLFRTSFRHLIYSVVPLAYFGLCRDEISKTCLAYCLKVLSSFGVNCKHEPNECIKKIVMMWKYVR